MVMIVEMGMEGFRATFKMVCLGIHTSYTVIYNSTRLFLHFIRLKCPHTDLGKLRQLVLDTQTNLGKK